MVIQDRRIGNVIEGKDRASGITNGLLLAPTWSFAHLQPCVVGGLARRKKFVVDFVAAWTKVMNADRFDLN